MEQEVIELTPIERLIAFYSEELFNEIVINRDSTSFWEKANSYLFENALTSFREGVKSLREGMVEDKDMFNYFSAFCFRIFSQPFTDPALSVFSEGFNEIADDPVFFKEAFQWNTKALSTIEVLLLFLCVHRNKITIMLDTRIRTERAAAAETRAVKGGKR
ncbi:hypothetical protein AH04_254 [Erwinia phage AH04]|uniref:Uncharacterized protein n=1 Tax=Erwinia phage AH04 TaxID=2869569 RepID=A0AAE8BUX5_9CAUD|nr:hypothetical protein PQC02_gp060 [Erwinia phage AH04]QZA70727.1 hypothetical protein AH04_254 [Erwinia phage AH04]